MNQAEAIKALIALAAENGVTVSRSKVKKTFVRLRDDAGYTDEQAYAALGGLFLSDRDVFIVKPEDAPSGGVVEGEVFARDARARWDNRLKKAGATDDAVKASRQKWDANHPAGFMATRGRGPRIEEIKLDEAKRQVAAGRERMRKLEVKR